MPQDQDCNQRFRPHWPHHLRILLQNGHDFELVLINEIENLETCAYLFQYDSVFGPFPGTVATVTGL